MQIPGRASPASTIKGAGAPRRRQTTLKPAPTLQQASGNGVRDAEEALALLREGGGSITMGRRRLLEAIFAASGHRTAQELARVVYPSKSGIVRSTIYRNLDELERLGVVGRTQLGRGPAVYHRLPITHGHRVCESCGTVIEPPGEFFSGLADAARLQFGFAVSLDWQRY